jgi:hypothetical protein
MLDLSTSVLIVPPQAKAQSDGIHRFIVKCFAGITLVEGRFQCRKANGTGTTAVSLNQWIPKQALRRTIS